MRTIPCSGMAVVGVLTSILFPRHPLMAGVILLNCNKMIHAFVSYVHENRALVHRLCCDLEKHGITLSLDRERIQPGQQWQNAIRQAIIDGAFFLACFSDEYAGGDSSDMNEELVLAIEQLRKFDSSKTWFIPIRLSDCKIPERMIGAGESRRDIQWVDLFDDWDSGIRKILSVVDPNSQNNAITISKLQQSKELSLTAIDTSGVCFHRLKVSHSFVVPEWELEDTFLYLGSEHIQLPQVGTTIQIDLADGTRPVAFVIQIYDSLMGGQKSVPDKLVNDLLPSAVGVETFEASTSWRGTPKTSTWGYLKECDDSMYFQWAPETAVTIGDVLSKAAAIEKALERFLGLNAG